MKEEEAVEKILEKAEISREKLDKLVMKKVDEFSGLVSREGAVFLVGKELGVELENPAERNVKLGEVMPGMNSVSFIGRVVNVSPVREFKTSKGEGRVVNVTFGDETGRLRLSLWNEDVEKAKELAVGKTFEVSRAFTREDNLGMAEARLGKNASYKAVDDVIDVVEEAGRVPRPAQERSDGKTSLRNVAENDYVSVRAALVQAYERQLVYDVCPECGKRLERGRCKEHKKVKPGLLLVVSGVVDDGEASLNAVFFRKNAETVIGMSTEEAAAVVKRKGPAAVISRIGTLGEDFVIKGVVKRNRVSDRLELLPSVVTHLNARAAAKEMIKEIGE